MGTFPKCEHGSSDMYCDACDAAYPNASVVQEIARDADKRNERLKELGFEEPTEGQKRDIANHDEIHRSREIDDADKRNAEAAELIRKLADRIAFDENERCQECSARRWDTHGRDCLTSQAVAWVEAGKR